MLTLLPVTTALAQGSTATVVLHDATADQIAVASQAFELTPRVTGAVDRWEIIKKPSWASFNLQTGVLSGTPGGADVSVYRGIRIIAHGLENSVVYGGFSITVLASAAQWVTVSDSNSSANRITEGSAAGTRVSGLKFEALTSGGNALANAHWKLYDSSGAFTIDEVFGDVSLGFAASLDYETATEHRVVVEVRGGTHAAPLLGSVSLTIEVVNVSESYRVQVVARNGQVTSSPSGIDCGTDCDEDYSEGVSLTLNAVADAGYAFSGWSGTCAGTASSLALTISKDLTCHALFTKAPAPATTLSLRSAAVDQYIGVAGDLLRIAPQLAGTVLDWDVVNRPPWMEFSAATGELYGVPSSDDIGVFEDIAIIANGLESSVMYGAFSIAVFASTSQLIDIVDTNSASNQISEDAASGTQVSGIVLEARDMRGNVLRDVSWNIYSPDNLFQMDETDGSIHLVRAGILDHEAHASLTIIAAARRGIGSDFRAGSVTLTITLGDVVDGAVLRVYGGAGGTVNSAPAGITCGNDCQHHYDDGETVRLTASAASGYAFSGWGGACAGLSNPIAVTVAKSGEMACYAVFTRQPAAAQGLTLDDIVVRRHAAVVGSLFRLAPKIKGSASWEIRNKPSWALFNTGTGEMWGVPKHSDIGTTENIHLIANGTSSYLEYGSFSVTVLPSSASILRIRDPNAPSHQIVDRSGIGVEVSAVDLQVETNDGLELGGIEWNLYDRNELFAIDRLSGRVTLGAKVGSDFLQNSPYKVLVVASYNGGSGVPLLIGSISLTITVLRADNPYVAVSIDPSIGGTVTSDKGGINCGRACSGQFNSGTMRLTAKEDSGYIFQGWQGDCGGFARTAGITYNQNKPLSVCHAWFVPELKRFSGYAGLDVGDASACAWRGEGTVWCWGSGSGGRLGNGLTSNSGVPVQVSGISNALSVSVGGSACALLNDGGTKRGIACWGPGGNYQLGNGRASNSAVPVRLSGISTAKAVSVGAHHACAVWSVKLVDRIHCWGARNHGRVGTGNGNGQSPQAISAGSFGGASTEIVGKSVSAGWLHTCAVATNNAVWCWGRGNNARLGIPGNKRDNNSHDSYVPVRSHYVASNVTTALSAVSLSAGHDHTCMLLSDKRIQCFGARASGIQGAGSYRCIAPWRKHCTDVRPNTVQHIATAIAVSASERSTCALLEDRTVRCWGKGSRGILGNGSFSESNTPVAVSGLSGARGVSVGNTFACAHLGEDDIKCWGTNSAGLGDGSSNKTNTPITVAKINRILSPVVNHTLNAGRYFSFGLKFDGPITSTLWQLNNAPSWVRLKTDGIQGVPDNFGVLMYGQAPNVAENSITRNITISANTGQNNLTYGPFSITVIPVATGGVTPQITVVDANFADNRIKETAVSGIEVTGLDLRVRNNTSGVVDKNASWSIEGEAGPFAIHSTLGSVYLAPNSTLDYDTARSYNLSVKAQQGNNTAVLIIRIQVEEVPLNYPLRVTGDNGTITSGDGGISCGALCSRIYPDGTALVLHARADEGYAFSGWGGACDGTASSASLVINSAVDCYGIFTPLFEREVKQVEAGDCHNCLLTRDGRVQCWGSGRFGRLGGGSNVSITRPMLGCGASSDDSAVPVSVPDITAAVDLSVGTWHACAVLADGRIKCWGHGVFGQLGHGSLPSTGTRPVLVTGLTTAIEVEVGSHHSFALLSDIDSKLRVWGGRRATPRGFSNRFAARVVISKNENSDEHTHRCVVFKEGGHILCSGADNEGQLGIGGSDHHNLNNWQGINVERASGNNILRNAVDMDLGGEHSCAVLSDGGVMCWGKNSDGQLGDGTGVRRVRAVPVSGLSTAIQVSLGRNHTCAVLSDGVVKCWGYGHRGRLGDGQTGDRNTPVSVLGISTAVSVSAGYWHSCALLFSGEVKCWGGGTSGQLGNNTTTDVSRPTDVATGVVVPPLEIAEEIGDRLLLAGEFLLVAPRVVGIATAWTMTNKPSWLQFSTSTGVFWGTPNLGDAGIFDDIRVNAQGSTGSLSFVPFSLRVVASTADRVSIIDTDSRLNEISQGATSGTAVSGVTLQARSSTGALINHLNWEVSGGNDDIFGIEQSVGEAHLVLRTELDRAAVGSYMVTVHASTETEEYTWLGNITLQVTVSELRRRLRVSADNSSISSADGLISCGSDCEEMYLDGVTAGLTTTPTAGYRFLSWQGGCRGTNRTVAVTMSEARICHAATTPSPPDYSVPLRLRDPLADQIVLVGEPYLLAPSVVGSVESWEITEQPSWTRFDAQTGVLYGVPSVADIGAAEGIVITASNRNTSVSYGPFTLNVLAAQDYIHIADRNARPNRIARAAAGGDAVSGLSLAARNNDGSTLADVRWRIYSEGDTYDITPSGGVVRLAHGKTMDNSAYTVVVRAQRNAVTGLQLGTLVLTVEVVEKLQVYANAGTVLSADGEIFCGRVCQAVYPSGSSLELHAAADQRFIGWIGGCSGSAPITTVMMDESVDCYGIFRNDAAGVRELDDQVIAVGDLLNLSLRSDVTVNSWTIANKPSWAQFSTRTGVLYGVPSVMDVGITRDVRMTATVSTGSIVYQPFSITVIEPQNRIRIVDLDRTPNRIEEKSPAATVVQGLHLQARDSTGTVISAVDWQLKEEADAFTIDADGTVKLAPNTLLDHPAKIHYQVRIGASTGEGANIRAGQTAMQIIVTEIMHSVELFTENGTVVSADGGINCGTSCTEVYVEGTELVLEARPDHRYAFAGWEGDCSGFATTTTVVVTEPRRCHAVFTEFQRLSSVQDIALGSEYTCLLRANGVVQCSGLANLGQIGGIPASSLPPAGLTSVPTTALVSTASAVTRLSAGDFHSCVVFANGTAQCWGFGGNFRLGDGGTGSQFIPVFVNDISTAVSIHAGSFHSCALLRAGTVRCWGANTYGETGSVLTSQAVPTLVSGLRAAVGIGGGDDHSCVILRDRSLRCWGLNNKGQLGVSGPVSQPIPVAVSGLNAVAMMDGGEEYSCALLTDGTVYCWGEGDNGRLGNGSTNDSIAPVAVSDISTAKDLAVGTSHACAALAYGDVYCWGGNSNGQLGNNSTNDSSTPVAVSGISSALLVGAGSNHSCAVLIDSSVYCWGNGASGQLGRRNAGDLSPPVAAQLTPLELTSLVLDDTVTDQIAVVNQLFRLQPRTVGAVSIWEIANQPSWAKFSTATGTLFGIPTQTHIGLVSDITITAMNSSAQAIYGPFSLTVLASTAQLINIVDTDSSANRIVENDPANTAVGGLRLEAQHNGAALSGVAWDIYSRGGEFTIDTDGTVRLTPSAVLDYETTRVYSVYVKAAEGSGAGRRAATVSLQVEVADALESIRVADTDGSPNQIYENVSTGTLVSGVRLQAYDEVGFLVPVVSWTTVSPSTPFAIGLNNAEIRSNDALDFETSTTHKIVVRAEASRNGTAAGTYTLTISVLDVRDDLRTVDADESASEVSELAATDTVISGFTPQVQDGSGTMYTAAWYLHSNPRGLFAVSSDSGVVSIAKAELDYEASSAHIIAMRAEVDGQVAGGLLTLTVTVLNELEVATVVDVIAAMNTLAENAISGSEVRNLRLAVISDVSDAMVVWQTTSSGSVFAISTQGIVRYASAEALDYETTTSSELGLKAIVSANNITLTASLTVTIGLVDVLEALTVTGTSSSLTVDEATPGATVSGLSLRALDEVGSTVQTTTWTMVTADTKFEIVSTSGVVRLRSDASLDYETQSDRQHTFTVSVSAEKGGVTRSASIELAVTVLNVLDAVAVTDTNSTRNTIREIFVSGADIFVNGAALSVSHDGAATATVSWNILPPFNQFFRYQQTRIARHSSSIEIDYEASSRAEVVVQAVVTEGNRSATGTLTVTVEVIDILENVHLRNIGSGPITIQERGQNTVQGVRMHALLTSGESDEGLTVNWTVSKDNSGTPSEFFEFVPAGRDALIGLQSGKSLDYETEASTQVFVSIVAHKNGDIDKVNFTRGVMITVVNVLETATIEDKDLALNTIAEDAVAETAVSGLRLETEDDRNTDSGASPVTTSWSLVDDAGLFTIDTGSGVVRFSSTATAVLDYETSTSHQLVVSVALSQSSYSASATLTLSVEVLNVFDEVGTIAVTDTNPVLNTIAESATNGTAVSGVTLQATDEGGTTLAGAVWSITSEGSRFAIASDTGVIRYASTEMLDYENQSLPQMFEVKVEAVAGTGAQATTGTLTVTIAVSNVLETVTLSDINTTDNTITENVSSGTAVSGVTLQAIDEQGTTLTGVMFHIPPADNRLESRFAIDRVSGAIRYASTTTLDYEMTPSTEVVVQAVANDGGVTVTGTLTVPITVLNVLETLTISDSDGAANTIAENLPSGTFVSGVLLRATYDIPDAIVGWSVISGADRFVVSASGRMIYASSQALDHETDATLEPVVQVSATAGGVTIIERLTVTIAVQNVLEAVTISDGDSAANTVVESATSGTAVSGLSLQATDERDTTLSGVVWNITPENSRFAIDSNSGAIRYASNEALDYETASSTKVVVLAVASAGNVTVTGTLTATITVQNALEEVTISDSDTTANTIAESATSGTAVAGLSLQATDERDTTLTGVMWNITSEGSRFAIAGDTGAIRYASAATLDYETNPSIEVVVRAVASANNITVTGTLTVTITVENVLEAVSISDGDSTANTLAENAVSGMAVDGVSLQAVDEGGTALTGVEWRLQSASNRFAIDSNSGVISYASSEALDYETTPSTAVVVRAVASANNVPITGTLTVTITIVDVLEALTITDTGDDQRGTVAEETAGATVAGLNLMALDENMNPLSSVMWSISASTQFEIVSATGVLRLQSEVSLDYEVDARTYNLTVSASAEKGGVTQSTETAITIDLLNTLENLTAKDTDTADSTISESATVGTVVPSINLQVVDENDNQITPITWSLILNPQDLFAVVSATGVVSLAKAELDFETAEAHTIEVQARSSGQVVGNVQLVITVLNVLERVVISDSDITTNTIVENAASGTAVSGVTLQTADERGSALTGVMWNITPANDRFAINGSGAIRYASTATLDYETTPSTDVVVEAVASANNVTVTGTLTVTVTVQNVLEKVVISDRDDTANEIAENVASGIVVSGLSLRAKDEADTVLSSVVWSIPSEGSRFAIARDNGAIRYASAATLDHETTPSIDVVVEAVASANNVTVTGTLTVTITVENVLETVTLSDSNSAANTITENATSGTAVSGLSLQAVDEGGVTLTGVMFRIMQGGDSRFAIDSNSGAIRYASTTTLDYEMTQSAKAVVRAVASANNVTVNGILTITITVQNVLEKVVISDSNSAANTMTENAADGTAVTGVTLQAADERDTTLSGVMWNITPENSRFAIDSNSGVISYASPAALDYETTPSTEVVVRAIASASGITVTGTLTVTITVQNVLEKVVISDSDSTANTINENAADGTTVTGVTLQAVDERDATLTGVTWSIADSRFAIDSVSGAIRYASSEALDYEATPSVQVIVRASASARNVTVTGTLTVTITVDNVLETVAISDSDDTANTIAENAADGTAVSGLSLQAVDEGGTALTGVVWNITSEGNRFAINSNNGAIRYASAEALDYETTPSTKVVVQGVASANNVTVTGTLTVAVTVVDVLEVLTITDAGDDQRGMVVEETTGATVAGLNLMAVDENMNPLSSAVWSISASSVFEIVSATGVLRLQSDVALDYEMDTQVYNLTVFASAEKGGVTQSAETVITINLLNTNETLTAEDENSADNMISESAVVGTTVSGINLRVIDDSNNLMMATWSMVLNSQDLFAISSESGVVRLAKAALDFETVAAHALEVQAMFGTQIAGNVQLAITVLNALEQVMISDTALEVPNTIAENAANGTTVSGVILHAADERGTTLTSVMWNITPENSRFAIADGAGVIRYASTTPLDYETVPSTEVVVEAVASENNVTVTGTLTVTITVTNVLEVVTLSDSDSTANTIAENATSGTAVAGLSLQAADEQGTTLTGVMWSIKSEGSRFAIAGDSGAIRYASTVALDHETAPSAEVVVQAVASAEDITITNSLTVTIMILDVLEAVAVTDTNPVTNTLVQNASRGAAVSGLSLEAVDEAERTLSAVMWRITLDTAPFSIDDQGVVRWQLDTPSTGTSYTLPVQAIASKGGVTATGSLNVTVMITTRPQDIRVRVRLFLEGPLQ